MMSKGYWPFARRCRGDRKLRHMHVIQRNITNRALCCHVRSDSRALAGSYVRPAVEQRQVPRQVSAVRSHKASFTQQMLLVFSFFLQAACDNAS